jgi:hypothetical protein
MASRSPSAFAAPEVVCGGELSRNANVLTFASILFSIIVGRATFGDGRSSAVIQFHEFVPDLVSQVIESGLSIDPDARASFCQMIEEVDSEAG